MTTNISVNYDVLDAQLEMLSSSLNNVPEYVATEELSTAGDMASYLKYIELTKKMEKLVVSYKQLLGNSATKVCSVTRGYKDADEMMSVSLKNAWKEAVTRF